jgi:transcriptional regulator with XRE-family HTH domain
MADQEGVPAAADRPAPATFAEKLNAFFLTPWPPGQSKRITDREVAAAITRAGVPVSKQYIWTLRKGHRTNPTQRVVDALAQYFGVASAYFYNDTPVEDLGVADLPLAAERDADVVHLYHRARGLSPDAIRAVLAMVEHARTVEGLDAGDGHPRET